MHLFLKAEDENVRKYYENHATFHDGDAGLDLFCPEDTESIEDVEVEDVPEEKDKALELDDIGDTLVTLARRAKDVEERELANQILNSAKFAKKTEFKKVEKDAGIGEEGE